MAPGKSGKVPRLTVPPPGAYDAPGQTRKGRHNVNFSQDEWPTPRSTTATEHDHLLATYYEHHNLSRKNVDGRGIYLDDGPSVKGRAVPLNNRQKVLLTAAGFLVPLVHCSVICMVTMICPNVLSAVLATGAVLAISALAGLTLRAGGLLSFLSHYHDKVYLAAATALCVAVGFFIGLIISGSLVQEYYSYDEHQEYTNVWPDELAEAHRDAAALVFAENGAYLDLTKSMGYNSGYHVYCVAPVTIRGHGGSAPVVQYWAAGVDCCSGHENYHCDDARNSRARAGLVIANRAHWYDFFMSSDLGYYGQATRMAMARYSMLGAEEPVYVRWVHDLERVRNSYWYIAWWRWLELTGACAVISLAASLVVFESSSLKWMAGKIIS